MPCSQLRCPYLFPPATSSSPCVPPTPTSPPSLSPPPLVSDDESSEVAAAPPPTEKEDATTIQQEATVAHQWWLPLPGQRLVVVADKTEQARRTIPGLWVICLNAYQVREKVSWSSNPACVHHFHNECIAKWLTTRQVDCPCCRRTFLTHKVQKDCDI